MTNRVVAIVGFSFFCVVPQFSVPAVVAAASSEANGARGAVMTVATSSFPDDNDRRRYYLETVRYSDDEDEGLIHIPMRTRSSVLRERNLFHLLEGEMDEGAHETFVRWWSSRNDVIDDGENDDENDSRRSRRLAASSSSGSESRRDLQETAGGGMHYLNAYVGTPPQRRVLALSNSADFTAFPCEVRGSPTPPCFPSPYASSSRSSLHFTRRFNIHLLFFSIILM
jgi:hypothetical protein